MMKKVNSAAPLSTVLYAQNSDGMCDVWVRRNMEQVTDEEGNESFQADEVFFRVPPCITLEEISADADFFFDQMAEEPDGASAEKLAKAKYAASKKAELATSCESTIFAGIDVELSTGTEHFSLTEKDQINLFGKQAQLSTGAEKLEYHNDGQPCKYYSAADMMAIITAAMQFVSYHTTYCNSLFMWLKGCTKASKMAEIAYGAAVPSEYRSEVLNDYLKA